MAFSIEDNGNLIYSRHTHLREQSVEITKVIAPENYKKIHVFHFCCIGSTVAIDESLTQIVTGKLPGKACYVEKMIPLIFACFIVFNRFKLL
jgi:hypothetical protein